MRKMGKTAVPLGVGDAKSNPALGFLTVVEHAEHGLFGGYLVLNLVGRPLEFHCTAPVKPNRAQQILYGRTLEPYLFGEQIGQTLLSSVKTEPRVVCTDREPILAVRDYVSVPVVLVLPPDGLPETGAENNSEPLLPRDPEGNGLQARIWRLDAAHGAGCRLTAFRLGRNRLAVPEADPEARRLVTERLGELSDAFDLAEPFQRIREAIEEARRGVE